MCFQCRISFNPYDKLEAGAVIVAVLWTWKPKLEEVASPAPGTHLVHRTESSTGPSDAGDCTLNHEAKKL